MEGATQYQVRDRVVVVSDDEYNSKRGTVWGEDSSDGYLEVELDGIPGLLGFLPSELAPEQAVEGKQHGA